VTERPTLDAAWFPKRRRYQQRHVAPPVEYSARTKGTKSRLRRRVRCDRPGCTAILAHLDAGGLWMEPGSRLHGDSWRRTATRPVVADENAPQSLGPAPVRITLETLRRHPVLAECGHRHRVRITAAALRGAVPM
jgi:hypothetical protein